MTADPMPLHPWQAWIVLAADALLVAGGIALVVRFLRRTPPTPTQSVEPVTASPWTERVQWVVIIAGVALFAFAGQCGPRG